MKHQQSSKKQKNDHDRISRKIKKFIDTLKQAEEDGDEDEDTVQLAKELLEELEYELDATDSTSEYELKICLRIYLICLCAIVSMSPLLLSLFTQT